MTDPATTFTMNLAGRDVLFRHPIPGQLIILRRRLLRLQQQASQTEDVNKHLELASQLVVDTLNVVDSLIVNPGDGEFLENAMLTGKLSHTELMDVLAMRQEEPKPKAAKRTPKAAPKTAVANRGRTKR